MKKIILIKENEKFKLKTFSSGSGIFEVKEPYLDFTSEEFSKLISG